MKTYRHLYPRVWAFDNLHAAYRAARKGKRGKVPAASFEFDLEANLIRLQNELRARTYRPGSYHSFYIHEPKRRLISAAPFRDRVVHHALCRVIEPIFEGRFISDSYANRVGKGTHRALDRCTYWARRNRYVLQCDVRQFFASIDHEILRAILARAIADDEMMWLIDGILESGTGVLCEDYQMQWFPADDLLAAVRPRGLPIGNLTSQFWGNCYLNGLDHFVKRRLGVRCYLRYVDDFLLLHDDKRQLHKWREQIIAFLQTLRLTLHEERAQVRTVTEGIPFLGFMVYPSHRRLKRRAGLAYRRRLRRLVRDWVSGRKDLSDVTSSAHGWVNHARYGDTWGLRRALFSELRIRGGTK